MKKAQMNSTNYNRLIAATKDFTGQYASKTTAKYIKLEFNAEKNEVTAIACDGYKLSVERSVCSCVEEDFIAFVRAGSRFPAGQEMLIELWDEDLIIHCGEFIWGCSQPTDKTFISYENVIPKREDAFHVWFNGDYLLAALKAVKASGGNTFRNIVVLEFGSPLEPVLIKTNNGKNIKMVLPVRIIKKDQDEDAKA